MYSNFLGTITCIGWKSDHVIRSDADGSINVWDLKTKASKHINTKRGMIKKIKFAPGKGNMKMLVLHHDSVGIWDIKEGELINELRAPKDLVSKPIDIDWAASDRPVIATQDGCLRIMSLALNSSTSSIMDYEKSEPIACHSLLPNKARYNFEIILHHQPWKSGFEPTTEDGFAANEVDIVSQLLNLIDPEIVTFLSSTENTVKRYMVASKMCGLKWESEFWEIAHSVLHKIPLDPRFDVLCDNQRYSHLQTERLNLHETRCTATSGLKRQVINQLLCLGSDDKAVQLLLDSEPSDPSYYEDNLRACLVASTAHQGDEPNSTMKLVATNLIAEGKLWEGVELLCLIDKAYDACQYLQSSNEWIASLWLAKCRLQDDEKFRKIVGKFCDHYINSGLRQDAVLIQLSIGDYIGVLDSLLQGKMIVLAAQFLALVQESKLLPDTSHVMVLTEEIHLAYARHLFDCGNVNGAFYYCDKADEKGEVLQKEFQVLMSTETAATTTQ